jgi:hypothetical protein
VPPGSVALHRKFVHELPRQEDAPARAFNDPVRREPIGHGIKIKPFTLIGDYDLQRVWSPRNRHDNLLMEIAPIAVYNSIERYFMHREADMLQCGLS